MIVARGMYCLKFELCSEGDVLIEINVRRFHEPRGKLNGGGKQETVISSRGMLE